MKKWQYENGFELRSMTKSEFDSLVSPLHKAIFGIQSRANVDLFYSESELADIDSLFENTRSMSTLRYGLFFQDELVGWHIGDQSSQENYYMRNSAVLPHFRRKGLYQQMLKTVLEEVSARGFQVVTSQHVCTNNSVIIAKLKAGFSITGLRISDRFGTLVELTWFKNEKRKALLEFRSGESFGSEAVLNNLGLSKIDSSAT